jgi:hypothetical protein
MVCHFHFESTATMNNEVFDVFHIRRMPDGWDSACRNCHDLRCSFNPDEQKDMLKKHLAALQQKPVGKVSGFSEYVEYVQRSMCLKNDSTARKVSSIMWQKMTREERLPYRICAIQSLQEDLATRIISLHKIMLQMERMNFQCLGKPSPPIPCICTPMEPQNPDAREVLEEQIVLEEQLAEEIENQ